MASRWQFLEISWLLQCWFHLQALYGVWWPQLQTQVAITASSSGGAGGGGGGGRGRGRWSQLSHSYTNFNIYHAWHKLYNMLISKRINHCYQGIVIGQAESCVHQRSRGRVSSTLSTQGA